MAQPSPITEGARRDIATVEHIPTDGVAAIAVAGEAVQLAIGFDCGWRVQPGALDRYAELPGCEHLRDHCA